MKGHHLNQEATKVLLLLSNDLYLQLLRPVYTQMKNVKQWNVNQLVKTEEMK